MKITTLKERIEKNEIKIQKKETLIEKKIKQIEKKSAALMKKYGIDAETFNKYDKEARQAFGQEGDHEIYWTMCEIDHLKDDLKRLPNEIEEITKTMEKQKKQIEGELEKESIFLTQLPESMKELEKALIEEWDRWDKKRQERLHKEYQELGYKEFIRLHKYSGYEFMKMSEEGIHKSNCNFARTEVLDLFNRVKDITGEVIDWSGIYLQSGNNFPVLNGVVIGKEGRAEVESIVAGGYNIQRLHIRTLVKKL